MLPGLDGWKLIETVRAEGIGTPIVVVSARGTEHDRVHALEIGADDYLVKPFSMKELVARVARRRAARRSAARRRRAASRSRSRSCGSTRARCRRTSTAQSAELTPTEFRLLYQLALERGRVVDPRRAAAEALGPARVASRPHGRRLRAPAAREDRPARVRAHVHPDALRRRLQARAGAEGRRGATALPQPAEPVASPTPPRHRIAPTAAGLSARSRHEVRRRRPPAQRDERGARRRGARLGSRLRAPRAARGADLSRSRETSRSDGSTSATALDGIETRHRRARAARRPAASTCSILPAALVAAHDKLLTARVAAARRRAAPAHVRSSPRRCPRRRRSCRSCSSRASAAGAATSCAARRRRSSTRALAALAARAVVPRARRARAGARRAARLGPAARRRRRPRRRRARAGSPRGGEWRTNVALGAPVEPVDPPPLARRARARGGRGDRAATSSGVDLLPTPSGGFLVARGERRRRLPARCTRSARRRLRATPWPRCSKTACGSPSSPRPQSESYGCGSRPVSTSRRPSTS